MKLRKILKNCKNMLDFIFGNDAKNAVEQLFKFLKTDGYSSYPHELIDKVVLQGEQASPYLLDILKQTEQFQNNLTDIDILVTFFILAKLKETRAFPYIIGCCCMPHHRTDLFFGDIATESLHSLLASTFNGNWKDLYTIAANQYLHEYVRIAAMEAHVILHKYDKISREKLISIFEQLFDDCAYDRSFTPTGLVVCCYYIGATELMKQIIGAYRADIVHKDFIRLESIQRQFIKPLDIILHKLKNNSAYEYIDNLYDSMGWLLTPSTEDNTEFFYQLPSRNDPCPCGSGKKYKRCCLR